MTGTSSEPGLLGRAARLWRTVRWLRAGQIAGRVRFRLARPRPDLSPPPAIRPRRGAAWCHPPEREASLLGPDRVRLLGVERHLDDVGWDDPAVPLLWRYNLHYFDDFAAEGSTRRRPWQRALMARWLRENPPGRGTAWAPYPCSLRIVNWIKWWLGGETPDPEALHSAAVQARWLSRRLEWHLLGNHLFVNAKALVFAGVFFEGPEAARWLATGRDILLRELPEQILPDGGQFERSPMYHALALEDVLDLLNLLRHGAPPAATALEQALRSRAGPMLHWMRCMYHADGSYTRFNDSAEGVAPTSADIERYAAELGLRGSEPGPGILRLPDSGYVRVRRGPVSAWLDVAPIGPDYLPGHAHADTLSFEMSLGGEELIVNRGTSEYGTGPRRQAERGTASHSTLQIGAHDSSEVWAGFRVGRRARPSGVDVHEWTVSASHDGYRHLPGGPRHHRRWSFSDTGVTIEDRLEPPARERSTVRFHLAPGVDAEPVGASRWRLRRNGAPVAWAEVRGGSTQVVDTRHADRFGHLVDARTLEVSLSGPEASVHITWADRCTSSS